MIPQILLYSLKAAFTLTLLYVPYLLILQKEKYFLLNRFVLLIIISLSLLLPFCNISWMSLDGNPIVIASQQQIVDVGVPVKFAGTISHGRSNSDSVFSVSWFDIIAMIYFIGMVGAIIIRCMQMGVLSFALSHKNIWTKKDGDIRICCRKGHFSPYCWMKSIVISEEDWNEPHDEIILHEKGHILGGHSVDMLILMFCQAVQWYNPFAWLIVNSLADIHEFEADDYVLRQGVSVTEYQTLLVKKAVGSSSYVFANKFKHSLIKKRIIMMNQDKSSPWKYCKILYLIPLICFALSAFATPKMEDYIDIQEKAYEQHCKEVKTEKTKIYYDCEALYIKISDGGIVDTITSNRNAVKEPTLSYPIGKVYINGKVATEKQIKNFNMYDFDSFHMSINTEREQIIEFKTK